MNTVRKLKAYLIERFPMLEGYYSEYVDEWEEEPDNEYAVFARIVKPFIEHLHEEANDAELRNIWGVLEHIASQWGDPARNEIFVVVTEEMELCKYFQYLGPTLTGAWIDFITLYPKFDSKRRPINAHVDEKAYRNRWLKEISIIGGFGSLTVSKEEELYDKLKPIFGIQDDENLKYRLVRCSISVC